MAEKEALICQIENTMIEANIQDPTGLIGNPRTVKPTGMIARLSRGIDFSKKVQISNPMDGIVIGYKAITDASPTNLIERLRYAAAERPNFQMFNYVYKVWIPGLPGSTYNLFECEDWDDKEAFTKLMAQSPWVPIDFSAGTNVQGALPPATYVKVRFAGANDDDALTDLTDPLIVEIGENVPKLVVPAMQKPPPGAIFKLGAPIGFIGSSTTPGLGDYPGVDQLPGQPPTAAPEDPYPHKMSEKARKKKRGAEGARLALYNDPYGYCTIGIGHLVYGTKSCSTLKAAGKIPEKWLKGGIPPDGNNKHAPSPTMTAQDAEALFLYDIEKREKKLVRMLKNANNIKVTQNQFDAMMSAVYNAGESNVKKHIITPYLAQATPDFKGAAEAFTVYGRMGYYPPGHERHLRGLKRLREKERALFYKA
jgi:GH24 family phage-related lysozyme (muramidase)